MFEALTGFTLRFSHVSVTATLWRPSPDRRFVGAAIDLVTPPTRNEAVKEW